MSNELPAPAAQQPVITQADIDTAIAASAQAERARISGLRAIAGDGNAAALDKAIAEGTQPGAFAIALRKAESEAAEAALGDLQTDAAKPEILPNKGPQKEPGAKVNRGQAYAQKKAAAPKA